MRAGLRVVFADLSFTLAGGGVLHVSGANGAGKTSLLRMICGLFGTGRRHYFAVRRRAIGLTMSLSQPCRWPEKHADPARNHFLRKPVLDFARATGSRRFACLAGLRKQADQRVHAFGRAKAASGADPPLARRVVCGCWTNHTRLMPPAEIWSIRLFAIRRRLAGWLCLPPMSRFACR